MTVEPGMDRKVTSLLEGLGGQAGGVGQVQGGGEKAGRSRVNVRGLPGRRDSVAKARW